MRKIAIALLLVTAVLMLAVGPSLAGSRGGGGGGGGRSGGGYKGGHGGGYKGGHHGGHRGHHHHHAHSTFVFGVGGWWGYPYWYAPYYPYYYPYYYRLAPPEEPPVYIEQSTQGTQAPSSYWYYCQSVSAYYPSTPSCPEAWIKVAPRTE